MNNQIFKLKKRKKKFENSNSSSEDEEKETFASKIDEEKDKPLSFLQDDAPPTNNPNNLMPKPIPPSPKNQIILKMETKIQVMKIVHWI